MAFSMFSGVNSPIAVEFGTSMVKLLQIAPGEKPALLAAAALQIPPSIQADASRYSSYIAEQLPSLLKDGGFRGRRIVCAVPSGQAFIQHMRVLPADGVSREAQIKGQLQLEMGCSPESIVVRCVDVGNFTRDGESRHEVISLAVGKQTVMRYVNILNRCKLEVVGVHTEPLAIVRWFDLVRRSESDSATLLVDLGYRTTRIAIAHEGRMRFARAIPFGGVSFDQIISKTMKCDLGEARAHRIAATETQCPLVAFAEGAMSSVGAAAGADGDQPWSSIDTDDETELTNGICASIPPGAASLEIEDVDFSELIETIGDELVMCVRYYRSLFPETPVDQAVFVGGEAKQPWLVSGLAKSLGLTASVGDPFASLSRPNRLKTPNLTLNEPQPGWAIPLGLCTAPTDL